MFYTILDDLIFYQLLYFLKRYSNFELKLHNYFYNKTNIYPTYINTIKIEDLEYIFFFIKKESYFEARTYLKSIRKDLKNKKITIIRADNILLNLIYNLFPDLCIYDIKIELNYLSGFYEISVLFLKDLNSYYIAVGRRGSYIKAINALFENYIIFKKSDIPIKIKCKVVV